MAEWGHREPVLVSPAFPGLRPPLTTCFPAPQDAFRAFHRDLDFVHKFMKPLLIGELAPEEPGQDHGKNVSVPRPRKEGRVCGERGRCSSQDRECRGGPRELYVSPEEPLPNIWGQRAPRGSAVSPLLSLPAWAGPLPSSNSFPTSSPPGSQLS